MLLIDNGNTRTKFVVYDDGKVVFEEKLVNTEIAQKLDQHWCTKLSSALGKQPRAWGCRVGAPEAARLIEAKLASVVGPVNWLHTQREFGGVTNGYGPDWSKLGADRWFALVGYRSLRQDNALIIDAGTALTIDWLKQDGHHLGGWIVPGRRLMQESLHKGTANLSDLLSESCHRVPAVNTQQGMSYGVHYALVGAIAQALTASADVFAQQPFSVVVTGGDGERLLKSLQKVENVSYQRIDDLVFKGLAIAADNSDIG
jgi:type III pantothenate kinase